jgi:peptidoglycan/xylan/chitin deacetylase (PgdA/CDA1 family)
MSNRPLFVISLDFELYWGMFDVATLEAYGANIKGVHHAIPEILSLFERHNVHATWATVGMLMAQSTQELRALLPNPSLQPQYPNPRSSSYRHITEVVLQSDVEDGQYYFGAHLVRRILATKGQELGSHTFSHYYALDGGENGEAVFASDCDAFRSAASVFGVPVTSFVFPRNQVSSQALRIIAHHGFTAYRGNPSHILYSPKKEDNQASPILRMLRLIDAYINISGHHTYTLETSNSKDQNTPLNIKASRFLRPYSTSLRLLESLRIARIKNSMTHAAKRNEVFHLWWHPHNFGIHRKENLQILNELLEHFSLLRNEYGMESVSMSEAAAITAQNTDPSKVTR